jgi:YggT family protein
MDAMNFLINIVFDLFIIVALLRLWLQLVRADFYNPVSQFVARATNPLVQPMRRVIPMLGQLDLASLILALLLGVAKILTLSAINGFAIAPVQIGIFAGLSVLAQALDLLFWIVVIRALLSWFSRGYNPMEAILHQLTEPLMAPIRRILPPMGGLDLSAMLVLIAIIFVQRLLGL